MRLLNFESSLRSLKVNKVPKHVRKRCPACGREPRRSNAQNSMYWLLLHRISAKMLSGKHSVDSWHLYFRSLFLGCNDIVLPNSKVVSIPTSTTTLDVAEFSAYYDKLEAWAAEKDIWLDELVS